MMRLGKNDLSIKRCDIFNTGGEDNDSKQANAFRQIILLMNMADDYCRMKQQAEEATKKYEQQEAEFYNMKREMVNMQMTIASLKKQLQEKPQTQAVCPYLQSLAKEAEAKNTQTAQTSQEKKQYPPYGSFANNAAAHKKK